MTNNYVNSQDNWEVDRYRVRAHWVTPATAAVTERETDATANLDYG